MKIKPTKTKEFEIIDVLEGSGKYKGKIGAFVIHNGDVKVRVGSGLSDEERGIFDSADNLIGRIIEVKYDVETPDGSLRFPRFVGFRPDKEVNDE